MPKLISKYNDEYANINFVLSTSNWISYSRGLVHYHNMNAGLSGLLGLFLTSFAQTRPHGIKLLQIHLYNACFPSIWVSWNHWMVFANTKTQCILYFLQLLLQWGVSCKTATDIHWLAITVPWKRNEIKFYLYLILLRLKLCFWK